MLGCFYVLRGELVYWRVLLQKVFMLFFKKQRNILHIGWRNIASLRIYKRRA